MQDRSIPASRCMVPIRSPVRYTDTNGGTMMIQPIRMASSDSTGSTAMPSSKSRASRLILYHHTKW